MIYKSGLGSITEVMTGKHSGVAVRLFRNSYCWSLLASKLVMETMCLLATCLVLFR